MLAKLHRLTWTFLAAAIVILSAPAYDAGGKAYATPTAQQISDRITQLTGLQPGEIDEIYAAEQAPDIVLIAYEVIIPIVKEPRISYLLVRVAATGQWIRVIIDNAEWDADFRPYLAAHSVEIHKQPKGTIDSLTPDQEAAQIATTSALPGTTIANIVLYGSPAGPGGAPAAAPQPHVEPDPGQASALASDQIGTTAGNFRVDESGAATYSIAIAAAAGTAGVAPQVSLNYSSSAPNGIAGHGWSVGGLSAISRCRSTLGQDLTVKPLAWTNDDQFCLDGQRLLLVSGNNGVVGATYRHEIDSGTLVTIEAASGTEPDYFKVERKDGSTSYYGKSPNSSDESAKFQNSSGETLSWSLRHFADSVGNPIWFDYQTTTTSQRISNIKYAYGNAQTSPSAAHGARIEFVYETRPDPISGYTAGHFSSNDQRLKAIRSHNTMTVEQVVREYNLNYNENHSITTDSRSRLTSIQECVGTVCLPKTTFTWALPELSNLFDHRPGFSLGNSTEGLLNYQIGDFDGNGQMDVAWVETVPDPTTVSPKINYALSTGTDLVRGQFTGSNSADPCSGSNVYEICLGATSASNKISFQTLDFNADGRSDLAFYDHADSVWKIYLSTPVGNGDWKLSRVPLTNISKNGALSGERYRFLDMTSDGLVDALFVGTGSLSVTPLEVDPTKSTSSSTYYRFGDPVALTSTTPPMGPGEAAGTWSYIHGYHDVFASTNGADFNGDGRVDFALLLHSIRQCTAQELAEIPSCQDVEDANADKRVVLQVRTGETTYEDYSSLHFGEHPARMQLVDINADGLTDVSYFHRYQDKYFYRINKGNGEFEAEVEFGDSTLGTSIYPDKGDVDEPQFTDWNLDGYQDLVWKTFTNASGNHSINIRYWDPATHAFQARTTIGLTSVGTDDESVMFADVNGDAAPDYIRLVSTGGGQVKFSYQTKAGGGTANRGINRIVSITNGLGATTSFDYEAISYSSRYERLDVNSTAPTSEFCESLPGQSTCNAVNLAVSNSATFYTALNGDWDLPTGAQSLGKFRPVLELMGPIYVVTRVEGDAPSAGTSPGSVSASTRSAIDYYYAEAKVQASGRGMLGFERLKTVDVQTGVQTTTMYRQDWPFIGHPRQTEVRTSAGYLLSQSVTDWEILEYASSFPSDATALGTASFGPIHPVRTDSSDYGFDFEDSPAAQGALLSQTETQTTYDSEANPDVITVTSKTGNGTVVKQVVTDNDYFDDSDFSLRQARLKDTQVTTTRQGEASALIRRSEFDYYRSGSAKGMLENEVIEPNNPLYTLTTVHSYDGFGNKVRSAVTGGGQTRCNNDVVVYDSLGRYPVESYDCLGRKSKEVVSRNKFGAATQSRTYLDTSGAYVVATVAHGALGREYFKRSPDGGFSKTYLSTNTTNCPANTAYKAQVFTAGGGQSEECFDPLARSTRTLTLGFDGAWDAQDTEYDILGRVKFKSEPYDLPSGAAYWSRMYYDILGRVVQTVLPDSSDATTQYDGLSTTVTNDLGHDRTEVKNVLGEVTSVVDNLNGTTTYLYDHQGNLKTMTDNAGNSTVLTFDLLGRKTVSNDPDKGVWSYVYNHFGELTTQTNANGHSSTMTYDALGRMLTRLDTCANATTGNCATGSTQEGSTTWVYDTAPYGLGQLSNVSDAISGYMRAASYDSLGRASTVTTNFDAGIYYEKTTYDQFGRVFQVFDASGDGSFQDQGIQNTYNSYGYLESVGDAVLIDLVPRTTYRTITAMDARGNVKTEVLGNGVTTTNDYSAVTGRLASIYSSNGSTDVQDLRYQWDTVGNLDYRHEYSGSKSLEETFSYDGLNRLTSQQVVGQTANTVTYDSNHIGNIVTKTGVSGVYQYGANGAGPHAVTSIGSTVYTYDANGNNLTGDGRTIKYTTFDKPYELSKGSHTTSFSYGPDRARYKRVDTATAGITITRYLGGVEIIDRPDGTKEKKRYIAGIVIETSTFDANDVLSNVQTDYLHKDHLGSLDVITNSSGQIIQEMSFDAWGQRRNATDWTALSSGSLAAFDHSVTTRGFTGHEMLDEIGIIHMNGRIYDQKLGRFLQADPYVQDPLNSQSLNRYSYMWNNPLNGTDPSGYFLNFLVNGYITSRVDTVLSQPLFRILGQNQVFTSAAQIIGTAVSAAYCGPCSIGFNAQFSKNLAYAQTGSLNSAFRAAAISGASSAAFFGVGSLNLGGVRNVVAHGLVGGAMSSLQGGGFGHGFASAGLTSGAGVLSGPSGQGPQIRGLIVSALVGGTASAISGGKFANGAVTGTFSYVLNQSLHTHSKLKRSADRIREIAAKYAEIREGLLTDAASDPTAILEISLSDFTTLLESDAYDFWAARGRRNQYDLKQRVEWLKDADSFLFSKSLRSRRFSIAGLKGPDGAGFLGSNVNYYFVGQAIASLKGSSIDTVNAGVFAHNAQQYLEFGRSHDLNQMSSYDARRWAYLGFNYYRLNYGD